jgi:hypothetical protein
MSLGLHLSLLSGLQRLLGLLALLSQRCRIYLSLVVA